jgi:large subunit ribosomal protein L24
MSQTVVRKIKTKIRVGDEVIVVCGSEKGRKGKVLKMLLSHSTVLVEGVNLKTHFNKPSMNNPEGGIELKEAPLHISNIQLVDSKENLPTKIGYRISEDGVKKRYSKLSGELIG